jgi:hypothetical protein
LQGISLNNDLHKNKGFLNNECYRVEIGNCSLNSSRLQPIFSRKAKDNCAAVFLSIFQGFAQKQEISTGALGVPLAMSADKRELMIN